MRIGSLFSGIGGLEMGLEWAGLGETVWQVEQSQFCRNVLAKHWPSTERFDDVRTVGVHNLGSVDLICGGFPCQDVSAAGKGAGLAGERSGLWREFARIINELRPPWVVVENVLSGASRWLDAVVRNLEELGYDCLPVPLSAEDVGAPHRRARLFIIAHTKRDQLRKQPGRLSREKRQGQALPADNGAPRYATHAERVGCEALQSPLANHNGVRELQPQGSQQEQRRRTGDRREPTRAGTWAAEPGILRVAHGVPHRSHRLKALGNAVVPQCGEVVGWVTRELMGKDDHP